NELSMHRKTGHECAHRFTARTRGENSLGSTHALQRSDGILSDAIDVDVRAELICQLCLVGSTADGDRVESHMPGKLDTEMPKAANALHGDQVSAAQAGISQGVIGRHSGTQERCSVNGTELIRNGSDGARLGEHHFCIPSVHADSQDHGVQAIHHVAATARHAYTVFAGDESDTHALAEFPL